MRKVKIGDKVIFRQAKVATSSVRGAGYTKHLVDGQEYEVTRVSDDGTTIDIKGSDYWHPLDMFDIVLEEVKEPFKSGDKVKYVAANLTHPSANHGSGARWADSDGLVDGNIYTIDSVDGTSPSNTILLEGRQLWHRQCLFEKVEADEEYPDASPDLVGKTIEVFNNLDHTEVKEGGKYLVKSINVTRSGGNMELEGISYSWHFHNNSKEHHFKVVKKESMLKTFVIYGKPHQIKAISEDLREMGFDFVNSSNQAESVGVNHGQPVSLESYKRLYLSDPNGWDREKTFRLPQDYAAALQYAKEGLEHWTPKIDLRIGGYAPRVEGSSLIYGCKHFTKAKLQFLHDTMCDSDMKAQIVIAGKALTIPMLEELIKMLK